MKVLMRFIIIFMGKFFSFKRELAIMLFFLRRGALCDSYRYFMQDFKMVMLCIYLIELIMMNERRGILCRLRE